MIDPNADDLRPGVQLAFAGEPTLDMKRAGQSFLNAVNGAVDPRPPGARWGLPLVLHTSEVISARPVTEGIEEVFAWRQDGTTDHYFNVRVSPVRASIDTRGDRAGTLAMAVELARWARTDKVRAPWRCGSPVARPDCWCSTCEGIGA